MTLKDWSEPLINLVQLATELKDTLNENKVYDAEAIVKQMMEELLMLHSAVLIAQWQEQHMDRVRDCLDRLDSSPVFGATK